MIFDFQTVKKQPVNFTQINKVLKSSFKTIKSSRMVKKISADNSFALAYESMLQTSLALMLSRGYRPKVQLGHHRTLVSFAMFILTDFQSLTDTYDKMRKTRNKIIYDILSVSDTEAERAILIAEKYFWVVEDKIAQDNPQQKLWRP